jgi:hypothetical protein
MRLTRMQLRIAIAVVALLALVGLSFAARAGAPTALANSADLAAQRTSAERTIDKVYKFGLEQLKTTRGLRLGITDAQAASIEQKYATQLKDLRRGALQAIAEAYALTPDQASSYVGQAEQRLDSTAPAASGEPTMLAPRLYQIVQRMADLGGQLTEAGIREMTQAPSGSPSPTARPSGSPSPSPSASR